MSQATLTCEPLSSPVVTRQAPFISILVPVRNEAAFIRATLEQLFSQRYPSDRFEVLVADGESTDATREIVAALLPDHANLRLLDNPRRLSSGGRNVALAAARGDLILLIDGHCELDNPHYLQELADAFERSGADCIGRPQPLDVSAADGVQRAIAAARASRLGHHPASFIFSEDEGFVPPQSVAVAYRRSVFTSIGCFDESFDACEDVEFNQRVAKAGLTCFFTPRVRVRYYPRSSLTGLFRQMVRYGRGRVRLLRKHPETFSPPGFVPAAFLLGVLIGPLLALAWPLLWWVYGGILALYLLTVLGVSAAISVRARSLRLFPILPAVFASVHVGAGWGILREAFARSSGSSNDVNQRRLARSESRSPLEHEKKHNLLRISAFPIPRPSQPPVVEKLTLNALTIDVEDYFHVSGFDDCVSRSQWDSFESRVEASTRRILDRLDEAGVKATFFILGWVAERHPHLVRAIHNAGHEIGCHSYWHRLIYQQTPQEFRADLRRGRDVLEDIIGLPVQAYRAPSFSVTRDSLWALDVLIEEGFRFDSSIYPTHHDRYGIAGTPLGPHRIDRPAGILWELPPPIWKVLGYPLPVGGGGYFRLYPYALTQCGLRSINAAGRPFACYLHPWELDPEQPRLNPGWSRAFRHYVNLHRTESRLIRLLRDFAFGTLSDALAPYLEPESVRAAA